jgi:hypothetical protein
MTLPVRILNPLRPLTGLVLAGLAGSCAPDAAPDTAGFEVWEGGIASDTLIETTYDDP